MNVDPFDSQLDDELERTRLRRVFGQGLDSVIGYVLPLQATGQDPLPADGGSRHHSLSGTRWTSGPWFFRDERMYLIPGDSPMGYRLPLDALPWVSASDYPYHIEQDPHAARDPLPRAATLRHQVHPHTVGGGFAEGGTVSLQGAQGSEAAPGEALGLSPGHEGAAGSAALSTRFPQPGESAAWLTRTALCVEARDPQRSNGPKAEKSNGGQGQHLYIFMPPLQRLEDYLDLLAAIEATAQALGVKIVLEGYPPPRDPRLKMLQVTPDPGVIEVNIHPSSRWGELVERTEFLYEAAWQTRLCAEKFMTDGRHTGTGGGNHFVLGGATPADSPFLRKPELLGSLIAYWHNHPSLSYLFSGLFIGPTSQAPRVDEARNDQLYELEIALNQIDQQRALYGHDRPAAGPPQGGSAPSGGSGPRAAGERGGDNFMPPWLVDRTLRNILIDVTGNTHRSEFCIDKLYSPDSSTGRLGLLELRAFEMPPHAQMSIAQQLLLRALVARFWQQPWRGQLTRWGTELHDRFMLPAFIRMDFEDVLADLTDFGYRFERGWFEPHFEFRFPLVGQVAVRGIELTLRNALEPWHVMGEEGAPGGTVRYVDASLERIEVRVSGYNDSRYRLTCNGRALPLQPTGTAGEYVAGVRSKAWNPPSALHPGIGVHAPLTFDIVDTWTQRSLGGCQYHVAHPGGRNYDTFPVNAYEAESRRLSRFFRMGHTPGTMQVPQATPSREFPFTLDLRW